MKIHFFEIDLLRGTGIIMMIIFHFFYDLNFFGIYKIGSPYFWGFFPRLIATIFIFLVGVSLVISYSRVRKKPEKEIFKKYLLRGLKIFSWGLIITLMTWIFLREGFIIFGILHFIGVSIVLAYPFLRYRYLNLFLGISLIVFGIWASNFYVGFNWLFWLGFKPAILYTVDYFPLLPWFGLVLIGLFFGNTFYPHGKRKFKIKELDLPPINFFCFLGRNSLLIYLIHQPILIAVLMILFLI